MFFQLSSPQIFMTDICLRNCSLDWPVDDKNSKRLLAAVIDWWPSNLLLVTFTASPILFLYQTYFVRMILDIFGFSISADSDISFKISIVPSKKNANIFLVNSFSESA